MLKFVSKNPTRRFSFAARFSALSRSASKRGEVRLRKDVVTESQTVEVPVTREELVIERVPASGQENVTGEIGTDQEIRVPLSEERVRVEKQPVVKEEVRVGTHSASF
jgi:uncharacterized protein (TIGR02271 family)